MQQYIFIDTGIPSDLDSTRMNLFFEEVNETRLPLSPTCTCTVVSILYLGSMTYLPYVPGFPCPLRC